MHHLATCLLRRFPLYWVPVRCNRRTPLQFAEAKARTAVVHFLHAHAADDLGRKLAAPGSPLSGVFDEDSEALSEYKEFDFVTARPASRGGEAAREDGAQAASAHRDGSIGTVSDDFDQAERHSRSHCEPSEIWSRARPESSWGTYSPAFEPASSPCSQPLPD